MARTIRNTVHTAARELDEAHPGWAYQVRMNRLDLDDNWRCILGQLYGNYTAAAQALDVSHRPELYEATTPHYGSRSDRYHDEWKRQIRARRGRSGTNPRTAMAWA